jgi:hypothetical protein
MVPNLAYPGRTAYPWRGVTGTVGYLQGNSRNLSLHFHATRTFIALHGYGRILSREPPTTCHCTSMPLVRSSHSRFRSLDIQHHGTYTQLNLLNNFISPMSGRGKGGKGLGKGGPSVTARFFVTTSKVSLISINVLVTHFQPRYRKARYSSSCPS